MRSSLFDYEWQFLTQMITRIHYTASYEELCRLLLEDQLPTLIPFDRAVVFQTGRQNGQGTVAVPYTVGMPNDPKENPFLDRAVIPRWSQFIMAPHSTVFLQSDLIAAEDWIHSDIYRNIWEPCRLYWALGATIQYRDRPLALVALFRERDKADFNPKEFHILHTLKDALERKFYDLLAEPAAGVLPAERLRQAMTDCFIVMRLCRYRSSWMLSAIFITSSVSSFESRLSMLSPTCHTIEVLPSFRLYIPSL